MPGIGGNFCHNENLVNIILPESVGLIGCDTFEGCSKLRNITIYNPDADIEYNILGMGSYPQKSQITIYGYAGSTAEAYANSYNINFSYIGDDVKPEITDVKMKRNYKGDIVVSVDTNGILPTSKIMAISLNSEGNLLDIGMMEGGTITFDVWKNAGIKTVKVFCWESLNSMRPLCEAKEVAVTL